MSEHARAQLVSRRRRADDARGNPELSWRIPERHQREPRATQSDAKAAGSPPRGAPDVPTPPPRGGGMCRPALLVSHHRRVRHLLLPRAPRRSTFSLRWTLLTTCRWPCQTTPPEASRLTIPFLPVYPRLRCGSKLPGINDVSTCTAWLCVSAAEWPLLVPPPLRPGLERVSNLACSSQ